MLKVLFFHIVFINSVSCLGQVNTTSIAADSGKVEFKMQAQSDSPNYRLAYRILSNQVKQNPKSAELRYFLGYAIDRLNRTDAGEIPHAKKDVTIECSQQFEEVNRLQPVYKAELFLLDPYSKLSAVWGSLALAYLNKGLIDSARWAFKEGKKRGGFMESILEYSRQTLKSCKENSILISSGDNISFPIWYLQIIENLRNDVLAIDASLLFTTWYPKYLVQKKKLKLSLTEAEIEKIDYVLWPSKTIEIINPKEPLEKFSWELKPTYMGEYVLKADRVLLDIFKQNFYSSTIYYLTGADTTVNLHLDRYLIPEGLVSRVSEKTPAHREYADLIFKNFHSYPITKNIKGELDKSTDAVLVLNYYRWNFISVLYYLIDIKDYGNAKKLAKLIKEKCSTDNFPFISAEYEAFFINVLNYIDTTYPD